MNDEPAPTTAADIKTTEPTAKVATPPLSAALPNALEGVVLAAYPATLVLGSLISLFNQHDDATAFSSSGFTPSSSASSSVPSSSSQQPVDLSNYFARKNNVFNVYFVKIGWFWFTLAFFVMIFSVGTFGPPFRSTLNRRRMQAMARYAAVTGAWILTTQWFFGPALIDRSFRWTGGQCQRVMGDSLEAELERAQMGDVQEALTNAACKAIGGRWTGGHDISGHVFLLILGSAMLWLELLPAALTALVERANANARRARAQQRTKAGASEGASGDLEGPRGLGIGINVALAILGLGWWMLLMTAVYFHTWFEKLTGFLVAFTAVYLIYFLPRGVAGLRRVLGTPGV